MFQAGQGILGTIPFRDGNRPSSPRTYLIVEVTSTHISVLNVSSVAGKEHKLLFPTNRQIIKYNPPFLKDSFVKLDSLVTISVSDCATYRIHTLHGGACLDANELSSIIADIVA